ncbi:MAG: NAD-dependent epimerase/dehydratase family protein [Caulobacteraceae bacterium]
MRIFVTGGSGQIGRAVVAELLSGGHQLTALVHRSLVPGRGVRQLRGSLARLAPLAHEIAAAEAIVHLASPRTNLRSRALEEDIAGTGALLDAWNGGRFIFASSQTLYGVVRGEVAEDAPRSAECWYDIAKLVNESQIAMAAAERAGAVGASLRIPLVLGHALGSEGQILDILADALLEGRVFHFQSEAERAADGSVFIGPRDLARGIALALTIEESGAYNLAGGFFTWREALEGLAAGLERAPEIAVRAGPSRSGEFPLWRSACRYDVSRFTRATGFQPRESAAELIAAYCERPRR